MSVESKIELLWTWVRLPAPPPLERSLKVNLANYEDLNLNPKPKRNYEIIKVPKIKIQKCRDVALDRRDLHKNHKSQNIFKKNSEFIGLLGECGYGITKNKEPDWSRLICGDKYDFKFGEAYIDVKSTHRRNGVTLAVNAYKPFYNFIYVMTKCTEDGYVSLVGWLRGTEVDNTIKDQYDKNKKNGFIPEHHFKDMKFLDNIIYKTNSRMNKINYYKV